MAKSGLWVYQMETSTPDKHLSCLQLLELCSHRNINTTAKTQHIPQCARHIIHTRKHLSQNTLWNQMNMYIIRCNHRFEPVVVFLNNF